MNNEGGKSAETSILLRAYHEGGISNHLLEEFGVEPRSFKDFIIRSQYRCVFRYMSDNISLEDMVSLERDNKFSAVVNEMNTAMSQVVEKLKSGHGQTIIEAWIDNVHRAYDFDENLMRECTDIEFESMANEAGDAISKTLFNTS